MANLETLVLTINANAENARQGIDNLITSLSSLSDAITKPYSDLRDFNAALKEMRDLTKSIKMPNLSKATRATGIMAKAKKPVASDYDPATNNNRGVDVSKMTFPNAKPDNVWQKEYEKNLADYAAKKQAMREAVERGEARREATKLAAQESEKQSIKAAREEMDARGEVAKTIIENASTYDLLKLKYDSLKQATIDDARAGKLSNEQLVQRTAQLRKLEEQMEQTEQSTKSNTSALGKLKEGFKSFASGISGILSRIKRIAITMLIRSAIRNLIKDVKEGITNVIEWSKTVQGEGNKVSKAVGEFKAGTATMKNALGAMLSPVIQALIPLLNSLTNAIINAANWFNQFISLLSGKTSWTKAIQQTADDVEDTTSAVGGATKAAKEAIAAFDELNVLTTSTGSGGGGGTSQTTEDYSNMFEQISQFDEKIQQIAGFVKENLETIKALALEAGAALLAWNFGKAFLNVLPTLSTIFGYVATGAAIALTITLTWLLTNEYLQTGDAGWLWKDMLTTALGSTAAAAIAAKLIGGQAGAWSAVITLSLSALTGITAVLNDSDVSAFSTESVTALIVNALKAGLATGILMKTIGGQSMLVSAGYGAGMALAVFGVAIGLKAALDKDVELFSVSQIVTTVTGAISGGLAAYLFFGTVASAGVGAIVTAGVLVALKLITSTKDMQWGNLNLTQEQIEEYVKERMFSAEANILINKLKTKLGDKATLEEDIRSGLEELNAQYDVLNLGIDKQATRNSILNILNGTNGQNGLLADLTEDISGSIDLLKLTVSNIDMYNGQGQIIDKNTLLSAIPAWRDIQNTLETDGKKLTELLFKGAKEQLTPEEEAYEQELLQKIMGLATRITQAEEFARTTATFRTAALSAMNKGSFQGIIDAFTTYSNENEETIRQALMEQIQGYYTLANLTDDPDLKAKWQKLGEDLEAGMEQTVAMELRKENEDGRNLVIEWMESRFPKGGIDTTQIVQTMLDSVDLDDVASSFNTVMRETLLNNGFDPIEIDAMNLVGFYGWDYLSEDCKEQIRNALDLQAEDVPDMVNQLNINADELVNIVNWDSLTSAEREDMINAFYEAYGSEEAIRALKAGMPDLKASELFASVDWSSFTDDQKKDFAAAVSEAYGSEEALKAAKEAGIDIGEMLSDSVDGSVKDPEIGATADTADAKAEATKINNAVDGNVKDPVVGATADTKSAQSAGSTLNSNLLGKDGLNGTTKTVALSGDAASTKTLGSNFNKWLFDTKSGFGAKTKSVALSGDATNTKALGKSMKEWMFDNDKGFGARSKKVSFTGNKADTQKTGKSMKNWFFDKDGFNGSSKKVLLDSDSKNLDSFKDQVDKKVAATRTVKIKADVGTDVGKAVGNTVGDAIKEKLKKVTVSVNTDGTVKLTVAASGAYGLKTGQLFIANEAGAEMVGSMDGKTTVANQEQIIEGIRRGVSDGQEEQNTLLREQNRLLMGILQKSGNVTIGASSALGRVVNQSLQMYGQMTGV